MLGNNKHILVEIDGNVIRTLMIQKKSKTNIAFLKAVETRVENEAHIGVSLKNILKEYGKKRIFLSFPRELLVLRTIEVTRVTDEELLAAIDKEIQTGLPFVRNNVLWNAQILSKESDSSTVLLAATQEDTLKQYIRNVKEAGIIIAGIIPSTIGLFESYRLSHAYSENAVLVVNIGDKRADLMVCENDIILVSRGLEVKGENNDNIISEIKQTINSMEHNKVNIKKIIINAKAEKMRAISEVIKTPLIEEIKFSDEYLKEFSAKGIKPGCFLICFGLALVAGNLSKLSLTLNEHVRVKNKISVSKLLNKVSIWVSVILLVLTGVLFVFARIEEGKVESLKAKMSSMGILSNKHWSDVFHQIFKLLPNGVVLSELSTDGKGTISLRGTTESRREMANFLDLLNKVQGFSAQLNYANEMNVSGKQVVQFQIKVRSRIAKDE